MEKPKDQAWCSQSSARSKLLHTHWQLISSFGYGGVFVGIEHLFIFKKCQIV